MSVSDRVERRAHLDDGHVGQESKVFEGLQSFWVTQPLIGNIMQTLLRHSMSWVQIISCLVFQWHFPLLLEFSPRAFVGDLSCSVLLTATIRFSLFHCCSTLNWTISSMNHFGQRWQSLPKRDNTTKQWNATQSWSKKQQKQKTAMKVKVKVPFWSLTNLRLPAAMKAESFRKVPG